MGHAPAKFGLYIRGPRHTENRGANYLISEPRRKGKLFMHQIKFLINISSAQTYLRDDNVYKNCITKCVTVKFMSTTITIRIPRDLKEKTKQNPAKWSEEVRNFIEERIKQLELLKTLREIEQTSSDNHNSPYKKATPY